MIDIQDHSQEGHHWTCPGGLSEHDPCPCRAPGTGTETQAERHYWACPRDLSDDQPCHCEGIALAEDAYDLEPPDLTARESCC